jgi:predicted lysophospholipase L1 biosynthesis ABC-type transport system permease subunit
VARRHLSRAFWVEFVLATATGLLAALTAAWPVWIEGLFGVDPDHGNGSTEWIVVVVCAAVAVLCASLARREWRRFSAAATA